MGLDMYLYKTKRSKAGGWDKAIAIHNWFVENVQDGDDDCGYYEVTKENAEELLALCKEVKQHPERAKELLPIKSGLFPVSLEYDKWYFDDIDVTIEILEKVLDTTDFREEIIEYSASW